MIPDDEGQFTALVAFLNARLNDDEQWAKDLRADPPPGVSGIYGLTQRMLSEVAAKRAIVRCCAARMDEMDVCIVSARAVLARQVLMDMAVVWDVHPGYRAEWKP